MNNAPRARTQQHEFFDVDVVNKAAGIGTDTDQKQVRLAVVE